MLTYLRSVPIEANGDVLIYRVELAGIGAVLTAALGGASTETRFSCTRRPDRLPKWTVPLAPPYLDRRSDIRDPGPMSLS